MAKKVSTSFRISPDARSKLDEMAAAQGKSLADLVDLAVYEFLDRQKKTPGKAGQDLPSCEDFIIAAIRKLRPNPYGITKGAKAGAALYKVYTISIDVYEDWQIREALQTLVDDGEVFCIGRRYKFNKAEGERRNIMEIKNVVSPRMDKSSLGKKKLYFDEFFSATDPSNLPEIYYEIKSIRLYAKADGLPPSVSKLLPGGKTRRGLTAKDIIESMRQGLK